MILEKYSLFASMKKVLVAMVACLLLSPYFAAAQSTVAHSTITFNIKNLGIGVDGTVGGLQATIHFNPADMVSASIEASVDTKTISTDNSLRDGHIRSDEFFDAPRYPKILIKSISIKRKGGNKYTGQFNLTIKNKTKTVEIPFTYTAKGDLSDFNGSFKINRLDYGLGDSSLTLSDEVVITIKAEFRD
jgi:polyisoprenoid-binding protein YceI